MRISGNYFIFETLNRRFLIYKLLDNRLIRIDTDLSDLHHNNIRLSTINQNKNQRYIFFYKYLSEEINLFDTETEQVIHIDLNVDDKWKQIEELIIDDNGNIVISVVLNNDLNNKKYGYICELD